MALQLLQLKAAGLLILYIIKFLTNSKITSYAIKKINLILIAFPTLL